MTSPLLDELEAWVKRAKEMPEEDLRPLKDPLAYKPSTSTLEVIGLLGPFVVCKEKDFFSH